jgi:hypothetical protein
MNVDELNKGYRKCIDGIVELTVQYLIHEYKSRMDMKKVRKAEEQAKAYLLGARFTFHGVCNGTSLSSYQKSRVLRGIDIDKILSFDRIFLLRKVY